MLGKAPPSRCLRNSNVVSCESSQRCPSTGSTCCVCFPSSLVMEVVESENLVRNEAFADAIGKVLSSEPKKRKGKSKSLILAKSLKDAELQKKAKQETKTTTIELVDEQGNVKQPEPEVEPEPKAEQEKVDLPTTKRIKVDVGSKLRIKPDRGTSEKERQLNAIATKGVVHLFNTVRQQQQTIEEMLEKAGPSEAKKDKALAKVSKKEFLDKLKVDKTEKKPKSECWKVLKDDFLMGMDSQNWDQNDDDEDT